MKLVPIGITWVDGCRSGADVGARGRVAVVGVAGDVERPPVTTTTARCCRAAACGRPRVGRVVVAWGQGGLGRRRVACGRSLGGLLLRSSAFGRELGLDPLLLGGLFGLEVGLQALDVLGALLGPGLEVAELLQRGGRVLGRGAGLVAVGVGLAHDPLQVVAAVAGLLEVVGTDQRRELAGTAALVRSRPCLDLLVRGVTTLGGFRRPCLLGRDLLAQLGEVLGGRGVLAASTMSERISSRLASPSARATGATNAAAANPMTAIKAAIAVRRGRLCRGSDGMRGALRK